MSNKKDPNSSNEEPIHDAKDADSPAEFVSPKYQFFSTKEIVELLESQGWKQVLYTQANIRTNIEQRAGKQRHMLIFEREDADMSKPRKERMQICIRNSHDRTGSFEAFCGVMNAVCGNQLYKRNLGQGELIRILHNARTTKEQLKDAIAGMITQADGLQKRIDRMKKVELSECQQLELAKKALELRYGKAAAAKFIDPASLLPARHSEQANPTLWNVFNRIQEATVRGGVKYTIKEGKKTKNRTTREMKSINTLPNYNSELWDKAEEFLQ